MCGWKSRRGQECCFSGWCVYLRTSRVWFVMKRESVALGSCVALPRAPVTLGLPTAQLPQSIPSSFSFSYESIMQSPSCHVFFVNFRRVMPPPSSFYLQPRLLNVLRALRFVESQFGNLAVESLFRSPVSAPSDSLTARAKRAGQE
jgi:hypothetical protein